MEKVCHVFLCRTALGQVSRKHRIYCRLIRLLGWSRWDHICVGYDQVVASAQADGYKFWAIDVFAERHPGLEVAYHVPLLFDIDLSFFEGSEAPGFWMTLLRWFTRGERVWTRDCVCMTIQCLVAGGIDIPVNLVSPRDVADWLFDNGYHYVGVPKRHRVAANILGTN